MSFIAQFTTHIEHIAGSQNVVADSLSQIDSLRLPVEFNLNELAELQKSDEQLKLICDNLNHPLKLKRIQWGPDHTTVYCEITGEAIWPYIPDNLHDRVFHMFHNPAHPSGKITDRTIRQRYVWPDMHCDIAKRCKNCVKCQQAKISHVT